MLFSCRDLSYRYPNSRQLALASVTLEIGEGEFVLVTGASGSGKSTFIRALSGLLGEFYGGEFGGEIRYCDQPIFEVPQSRLRSEIGVVLQDPEKQVVIGRVEQELAFGLESLGLGRGLMHRRVAETAAFLNLQSLLGKRTDSISSGELQKVVLGAVLAMMPKVLLLDEPTVHLSPTAGAELFSLLTRLQREVGLTIVLIEHRLDECFHSADQVLFFEGGRLVERGKPNRVVPGANGVRSYFLPASVRLLSNRKMVPGDYTVRSCRTLLGEIFGDEEVERRTERLRLAMPNDRDASALEVREVSVSYPNSGVFALNRVCLAAGSGGCVALVGDNGAGKTTLLRAIAGMVSCCHGEVKFNGKPSSEGLRSGEVAYLGQDPNCYLFNDTVEQELEYALKNLGRHGLESVEEVVELLGLADCRQCYPRDLSSGQRQRVALGSLLVMKPNLLLLDEPTRGSDPLVESRLIGLLRRLMEQKGTVIVLATQDLSFAARVADKVVVLFQGEVVDCGRPCEVFHDNLFFTTPINRLFRGIRDHVVTLEEAQKLLDEAENGK